jgi:hypothetical protein
MSELGRAGACGRGDDFSTGRDTTGSNTVGFGSDGAALRSGGVVLGDSSNKICDNITMSAGSGVRNMGGSVPGVGTGDGGRSLPAGGHNNTQGADGSDDVVEWDGSFLGAHSGRPPRKLAGGPLGALCNSILDSGGLGSKGILQAGVLGSSGGLLRDICNMHGGI